MKRPFFDRRKLIHLVAILASILFTLLLLILIPLKTHQTPVPEVRYTPRPRTTEAPAVTPEPQAPAYEDPSIPDPDDALTEILEEFALSHAGSWDLYVINLSRGEYACFSQFEDSTPVSASLIKLFIMGAAYQQIQEGVLSHDTLWPYIRNMVARSDNDCANVVIKHLGAWIPEQGFEAVNAFAESIGCPDTKLKRMMMDDSGVQNYTTAADCARFLRMLYRFELSSQEYSTEMVDYLKMQQINDRIPALLPAGTVCAHKTGDLEGISCGDAGIVFSPHADYIFCAICNGYDSDPEATADIAALSLIVYEYYNPSAEEEAPASNA